MNHYYALLGVLPNASPTEINASYRQLAKRFHPDVAGGNSRFFARVREAYETLSEPRRRRAYTITNLLAEVNGNGLLEVRNTVYEAHCDVRDSGQVRLARVTARLDGTCSPGARVVLENPSQDMSIAG